MLCCVAAACVMMLWPFVLCCGVACLLSQRIVVFSNVVLFGVVLCCSVLCCALLCCAVLCCVVMSCLVFCCVALY